MNTEQDKNTQSCSTHTVIQLQKTKKNKKSLVFELIIFHIFISTCELLIWATISFEGLNWMQEFCLFMPSEVSKALLIVYVQPTPGFGFEKI